jgi:cytochrome P450
MFRFDPYSPAIDADPFPAYKTLRDEHPCFWSEEAEMWVYSRYADIMTALNDWETYSSARGNLVAEFSNRAGNTLGTTDPPRHDRLRALIQKAVTKRALDHIIEPVRLSANKHLDNVAGRDRFDFVNEISANITLDLLFYLFDISTDDRLAVRDNGCPTSPPT